MEHELENITFYAQNHIAPLQCVIIQRQFATSRQEHPHLWNRSIFVIQPSFNGNQFTWIYVLPHLASRMLITVNLVYSLLWLPWAPPLCHHIILTAHWRTGRKSWLDSDTWVAWDLSKVALEVVKKTSFNYYDKGVQRHFRRIFTTFGLKCKCINSHFKPRL